ncbi:DUF485 domain-containing protein [Desulforudis sp. 1088]|uniref:DUF485 domain-containing protein n=1 Tax=unclassified Candidatus Desulforudis TaxID=2635950 RepID=UPI00346A7531
MDRDEQRIEDLPEFKSLVVARWTVASILTLLVFVSYYGFILLVGYSKETIARKIGDATTLGIPMVVLVIVISFVLTLVYVLWANSSYDSRVTALRQSLEDRKKRGVQ